MKFCLFDGVPGGIKGKENPSLDLYLAALNGDVVKATVLILDKKADTNYATLSENETPLHAAAQWGHVDMVDLLLKNGAEINKQDKYNRTPLDAAFIKGHDEIVEKLKLNGGVHLSPDIDTYKAIREDIEYYKNLSISYSQLR